MTTKCFVICWWLKLLIGFTLLTFIKCDCPFPEEEIINGYAYLGDAELPTAKEQFILTFRCSVGYNLIGSSHIQCFDGKWSDKVPSCEAMLCDSPPRIANGTYTFTTKKKKVTIGTQAIYSCKPGYELSNAKVSNLTCILNEYGDETLWAGELPVCKAMKPCSDPGVSMNGSREGDCCLPGSIVRYSCDDGFETVGEKEIECLPSKLWSSPRPLCKPLGKQHCELPPQIPNGVVIRKSGDYALADEEVDILCEPGYKLNGSSQYIYCDSNAQWEEEFGECVEISCDRPEPLVNGNIPELEKSDFNDTFPYNFVLTYDCNEGYRLQGGDPWRVCDKDGWTGKNPYCEKIYCPDPGSPQNGKREGDSFKVGAKISFMCFTGYELLGSLVRYCKPNGRWTGELARCNDPANYCPNPGTPINGMKEGESYDEGDIVKFRCRSGFIQTGSKEMICMSDGTWNGTQTKCLGPYDFDSTQEIGNNLKNRLDEKFDEEVREYERYLAARGLTGKDGRAIEIPPNGRLIMYFAFDVSGSITRQNFKKGINFAKAIVNKIQVSEKGTRVGALIFSNIPENIFFPMDCETTEEALEQLDAIPYKGGGTSASSALEMMIDNVLLQERRFVNETTKTILFLITDGKANMGGSAEKEADTLKKMGVEIFCIGITGDVKLDALYQIASSSKYSNEERPNVFVLKNYESLSWLIQDITNGTLDYSQCGLGMESKMNSNIEKMIGGEISQEPWPWMAALYFQDPKKKTDFELQCGGSIISGEFILTAAHCMFRTDMKLKEKVKRSEKEIIVKLGMVETKNETLVQDFGVKSVYVHDGYTSGKYFDNDIALLKLSRPILYNPHIRPICLPPAEFPDDSPFMKPKEYGWVTGWGHTKKVRPDERNVVYRTSKSLKELRMPIQPRDRCTSSLKNHGREVELFTERMYCAGDGESGNDTCKGDSGGPFLQPHTNAGGFVYWTQVGLVSWGIGCGNKGLYGFYTDVQKFLPWIHETINQKN